MLDSKGINESGSQLLGFNPDSKVEGGKPDLLQDLTGGSLSEMLIDRDGVAVGRVEERGSCTGPGMMTTADLGLDRWAGHFLLQCREERRLENIQYR